MTPTTVHHEHFRFLDLPAELRCCVYDNIEFPTTWHVLDRVNSGIDKLQWEVPPLAQVYDSRVTLIRPHTERIVDILATCRLINKEARQILKRKIQHCRLQPVRYLVDYSAAWALIQPFGALNSCLGMADKDRGALAHITVGKTVRNFLRTCDASLSQTQPSRNGTQNGAGGVQTLEMTITHKSNAVYGREVHKTVIRLNRLKFCAPSRLVVIYKTPLPRTKIRSGNKICDSSDIDELLLEDVPREPEISNQASPLQGVFVRPLTEEAFEKHVKGLEYY